MSEKHTPGPWETWFDDGKVFVGAADESLLTGNVTIAELWTERDTALIAAAPDLLAALKNMCMSINYEHDGQLNDLYGVSAALEAIARAEGTTEAVRS